jgi:hypothetical protein
LKGIVTHLRNGWAARQLGVLTGRLPRERTFTDQAQAHALTENSEDLSSTVGSRNQVIDQRRRIRSGGVRPGGS